MVIPSANPIANGHDFTVFGANRFTGNILRFHMGVDLVRMTAPFSNTPVTQATAVVASATGTIACVYRWNSGAGYGNRVVIRHEPANFPGQVARMTLFTMYAHLGSILPGIQVGVPISVGDPIGTTGTTGSSGATPYVHWEILNGLPPIPTTDTTVTRFNPFFPEQTARNPRANANLSFNSPRQFYVQLNPGSRVTRTVAYAHHSLVPAHLQHRLNMTYLGAVRIPYCPPGGLSIPFENSDNMEISAGESTIPLSYIPNPFLLQYTATNIGDFGDIVFDTRKQRFIKHNHHGSNIHNIFHRNYVGLIYPNHRARYFFSG